MKKHRKLYPTNGTDCSSVFCDVPFSEYLYPQPPPPPSPSSLAVRDQNDDVKSHVVSPSVIVLLTVLSSFLLLLLYYVVVSKSCFGLIRRRTNRATSDDSSRSDGGDEREQFVDHHQNPIWLIATVGLQQPIINSITVVRYRRGEGLIEGTECSVCLSEFRDHQTLRLLPKCNHAFHVSCIDTWLRSHTNCPLCRAHIVADPNGNGNGNESSVISGGSSVVSASHNVDVAVEGDVAVANSEGNAVVRGLRRSVSVGVVMKKKMMKKRSLSF